MPAPPSCTTRPTMTSWSAAATGCWCCMTARSAASSPAPRSPSAPWSAARSISARSHADAGTPIHGRRGSGTMTDHALSAPQSGDWRYWFGEQRGTLLALAVFVVMFVIYTGEPSGRLQRRRGHDRREQGRAAGADRHRADLRRADRRHRSLDRHDLHPVQLRRLLHRRRHGAGDDARRVRRAADRPRLRRAQRPDRDLWPPAADRDHHRDRRGVLRHRLAAPAHSPAARSTKASPIS